MNDKSIPDRDLDLWAIGNCQVSALIDREARMVWSCIPRVDGDPLFSSLLDDAPYDSGDAKGFWSIDLADCERIEQEYIRNTPILVTRKYSSDGSALEITDFCPRFRQRGRTYRPVAYCRIIRPLEGSPRIRMRLKPTHHYGQPAVPASFGSNHITFTLNEMALRLTTDGPIGLVDNGSFFRLERPLHFFLGPDESMEGAIGATLQGMLENTTVEWQQWVRGLAVPLDWQEAVIRAAIALKLCQHEDTGAIVAALTTSVPEHAHSGRNWDYRFCWLRDAYYTVQALNRIGALDVLEGYLFYLRNVVDSSTGGHIQPLYDVRGNPHLEEASVTDLNGYRGMGPVRRGNQAYEQIQHDAYGQIILSSVQAFVDHRLLRMSGEADFRALERIGDLAWQVWDKPDAGLWELRTRAHVHTYSAAMCWAACDRLWHAATAIGLEDRAQHWQRRANHIHTEVMKRAWRDESQAVSANFEDDVRDASILQLLDMRFLDKHDPRFRSTVNALEETLRRGDYMLRYSEEDDFGLPETAFNVCTFWLIESLFLIGRENEARDLFDNMLEKRTASGLLSEDIDPRTDELWGNFPQTYSLVGIINCAVLLTRPWNMYR